MKATTFGVKVWRWMSMVFLIGALLWTYSVFPEMVAVDFASNGEAEMYVDKSYIFYIIVAIFVINNVVISRLAKQVPKMDASFLPIPNRKIWALHRTELNEHVTNWIYCLVAVINTITGFSLLGLATVNSEQYNLSVFDFSWIFYLGLVLMLVLFALPLRMFWTPVPDDKI